MLTLSKWTELFIFCWTNLSSENFIWHTIVTIYVLTCLCRPLGRQRLQIHRSIHIRCNVKGHIPWHSSSLALAQGHPAFPGQSRNQADYCCLTRVILDLQGFLLYLDTHGLLRKSSFYGKLHINSSVVLSLDGCKKAHHVLDPHTLY